MLLAKTPDLSFIPRFHKVEIQINFYISDILIYPMANACLSLHPHNMHEAFFKQVSSNVKST